MKITHFGHACVLVELTDRGTTTRLLFDPGAYATGFEELRDLDAILFTHEHPDHLDVDRLPALLLANPRAEVIADPSGSKRLWDANLDHRTVAPGDTVTLTGTAIQVLGGEHAVIHPDMPCVHNNAYLIDGLVLHPGDSFTVPPSPVRVLLVPTGGPWMKASEGIDYLRAVAPEIAVPVHQAGLADIHQQLHYQLFSKLGPDHTEVRVLQHGTATSF